jgi:hypothetical protein
MIVIYGTHHYGKVDSHDHQYQLLLTNFRATSAPRAQTE